MVSTDKPKASIVQAISTCTDNGHNMVDVFDLTTISGGHVMTTDMQDTYKAQCSRCKALLRFYHHTFMSEALQVTCRYMRVAGDNGRVLTASEKRAQNTEAFTNNRLNDWCYDIHQYAKDKGWWDTEESRNFGDLIALLHTELSEAYEEYRNGHQPDETYWIEDKNGHQKPEGIPSELADVAIRLFDMCGHYGIDLENIVEMKHRYNLTREYRHGGKVS